MKGKKYSFLTVLIVTAAVLIHIIFYQSVLIEKYYSQIIYPVISGVLKFCFGWIPFSLGDIIYAVLILWLLSKLIRFIISVKNGLIKKSNLIVGIIKGGKLLLLLYIFFNILWGLNYNRVGIAEQLNLNPAKYSLQDLILIDSILLEKVNTCKASLLIRNDSLKQTSAIFNEGSNAYNLLSKKYAFLKYSKASVKPSAWGWLGNYVGFIGYYNPFTGEAQVNTTVPQFIQPFTVCHEIGHQLGYAKENEANFVGYLAATASPDTAFHYSAYLDLFMYAQRSLFEVDTVSTRRFALNLSPTVKADIKLLKEFDKKHKSFAEPVFRWLYGKYLQQNQQPSGILSYDEVTGLLLAYYKKEGKI